MIKSCGVPIRVEFCYVLVEHSKISNNKESFIRKVHLYLGSCRIPLVSESVSDLIEFCESAFIKCEMADRIRCS